MRVKTGTQVGTTCLPTLEGEAIHVTCDPELDWLRPFNVRVTGLHAVVDGDVMASFEETLSTPPGADRAIEVASSLTPPPFPAELCPRAGC